MKWSRAEACTSYLFGGIDVPVVPMFAREYLQLICSRRAFVIKITRAAGWAALLS
ncbi:hypothetical protein KP509_21G045200 [Ceratopteris richardii]|uniref:Uncharacterized protein n=1 Tax=Ceratopteris richardii TaxID=49495 RepID=A0A8T2S9I1_CERRI|nr:hypothetical protein KP509_21G045200 [Ceratopteris richardii]